MEEELRDVVCPNCGATVDETSDDRCPSCDAPLKVVCPNCGGRAPADADECPACAASLAHGTDSF